MKSFASTVRRARQTFDALMSANVALGSAAGRSTFADLNTFIGEYVARDLQAQLGDHVAIIPAKEATCQTTSTPPAPKRS